MKDLLYNIMLHINYTNLHHFLINKETLDIYNSLFFWKNYKNHMYIPIYKNLLVHDYHQIVQSNIKRINIMEKYKNRILTVVWQNLDFLKWVPHTCFDIFVNRTEMSLYVFKFYINVNQKMIKYVANNQNYHIQSDPYFLSLHDFNLMITKLCYYKYNLE
jgi:hypothetical protein